MQKRISYYEYKKRFPNLSTVFESYDKRTKTIVVEFPDDFEYTEMQKSNCNWIKIEVHLENVVKKKNFFVIRLPYCSEYRDYVVFVSPKLMKEGFTLSIQDTFTMKLKKYDDNELIDEKEMQATEFAKLFDCPLSAQAPPPIHVPEYHAPVLIEVLEELKDDE